MSACQCVKALLAETELSDRMQLIPGGTALDNIRLLQTAEISLQAA